MLTVKLLEEGAIAPVCSRPQEDLGYDLFALETVRISSTGVNKIRTGVAVAESDPSLGFIIKDRSSMAAKGLFTHGGVIDPGYRGEIVVLMSKQYEEFFSTSYTIQKGDKIAQLVPVPVLTHDVKVVDVLPGSGRGELGFGSSGR